VGTTPGQEFGQALRKVPRDFSSRALYSFVNFWHSVPATFPFSFFRFPFVSGQRTESFVSILCLRIFPSLTPLHHSPHGVLLDRLRRSWSKLLSSLLILVIISPVLDSPESFPPDAFPCTRPFSRDFGVQPPQRIFFLKALVPPPFPLPSRMPKASALNSSFVDGAFFQYFRVLGLVAVPALSPRTGVPFPPPEF